MVIPVTLLVGSSLRKVRSGPQAAVPSVQWCSCHTLFDYFCSSGLFFQSTFWWLKVSFCSVSWGSFPRYRCGKTWEAQLFFPPKIQCNTSDFLELNIGFALSSVNVGCFSFFCCFLWVLVFFFFSLLLPFFSPLTLLRRSELKTIYGQLLCANLWDKHQ